MSDEKQQSSSGSGKRRRRRRPSRKRNRSSQSKRTDVASAPDARSGSNSDQRSKRRRRRRRKSRSKASGKRHDNAANVQMLDAKLSESIFVYTHVLRSSELDTYGFRPDPFLNSSRSLADFRIDLTPIFPEDEASEKDGGARVFDAALHGPIITSIADTTEDDDESVFTEDEGQPDNSDV